MELNHEDAQGPSKSEVPLLPKECSFTMQQWLYRRTIHTKRYKKRYVVLHNERLYTFTKIPSFDKFDSQNINNVLKSASNSWILTGSFVTADPDVNSGLYKWRIQFKNYKKPVSASVNLVKFICDKPALDLKSSDHIDSIFEDVTSTVLENKSTTPESQDCLWFATTNHKIASDWVIALLHTSRYGSLYNLIYKNPSRRRYQQFTLPWYLMVLDYLPNLSNDENPKQPLTSFTYIKINILRLFDFPVLPNAKIYCAVEFNSSFYILQLYRYESDSLMTTPTAFLNDDDRTSLINTVTNRASMNGYTNALSEGASQSSANFLDPNEDQTDDTSVYSSVGLTSSAADEFPLNLNFKNFGTSTISAAETIHLAEEERLNLLTRLKNLNSGKIMEKKQIVEKRSIAYNDAYVCIPVYKNTTQEVVWLHFFGNFDVYLGTASIRDLDFGSRDPAPVKTCMIKLIDSLNPLNYKRVDVSTFKGESTVLNKSSANATSNDRGFVELSVVIPKHLGNFLDPVTISYGSPKEYLSNATKSSITAGIQMLIANIKRVRQSFTVLKDIIHALKSVLEFRSMASSFLTMSYFILVFGIFPNRMIIIFLLPLLGYIICTHPSFVDMTFLFLLKFPILTAILPKRLLYPFLLIPKTSCILCSKKPSFLQKNAQTVNPDMVTKVEISSRTFHYSSKKKILPNKSHIEFLDHHAANMHEDAEILTNPFSAVKAIQINPEASENDNTEAEDKLNKTSQYVDFQKRISVHLNSLPMITSKHLLNDSIEVTRYRGTRIETCKHRGIILSYLSIMFINEMGAELFDSVKGDGLSIIKGYHDIYYNTPPYRHVPFWANVKFTFYFFMYMLFLTLFGGITNLHLLHLLHKNKLMCRLTLESTGVSEDKPKGQHSESKPKTTSLYENERRIMFGRFSKVNLRFYERTYFSTEDGQFVSVDLSKHIVRLVVNDHTDPEGWMYARNWNSHFSKTPTSMTFVRRRKWLLTPKERNTEYILKRRFPSNLTSDYFTEIKEKEDTLKRTAKEEDVITVSSTESFRSPVQSNQSTKEHLKGIDLIKQEINAQIKKRSNYTKIKDLKNMSEPSELKIDPDENVTKLYSRRRKIKGIVDKFKDMRERRRNQKEDSSNMQMYINKLVKTKHQGSTGLPQIKGDILKGLGFIKQKQKKTQMEAKLKNKQGLPTQLEESENSSNTGSKTSVKIENLNSSVSVGTSEEDKSDILMALMNINKNTESGIAEKTEEEWVESQGMSPLRLNSGLSASSKLSIDTFKYKEGRVKKLYSLKKFYKTEKKEKPVTVKKGSNKKVVNSKIARLLKYIMTLYKKEEEPPTDRTEYSTISQLSTSSKTTREKGILWKMMETAFAIMFALPICILLDLFKMLMTFLWLFMRTLLGIPESEDEPETSVTKMKINKYKRLFKLVTTEDNEVYFKITTQKRCFLVGERIKIFKKICRAEKISFMHNMNKLMFSSSKNYEDNSDTNSEQGSVSSVFSLRQESIDRMSDDYMEDSDAMQESDVDTKEKEKEDFMTEDELEELKAISINPFDLDDSEEDIINIIRKSYSQEMEPVEPKTTKRKKGKIANYLSTMYLKRIAKKGKYVDEQHLSDYEQDSDENIKNDNKIGLIATLKKLKDQIVMANYKINLYNMRFEKLLNMFSWKNYSVTTIVLFLLMLVIVLNLLFSIEIIMLAYILIQFKSGYRRGTWERIILITTQRHINKAIMELEIFRPFWDLSTHQIKVLANRIKSFSSIELEVNTIREAKDETHLAYIVSDRLISTKFARNWKRYRWINNLFRQAPCKQY